ncbi:GNAT family N-acetyltransferase [bacterium]|jgi:ribosomal protein S18 acetylase RimI-like enzyme|nr:GNAT family N-acetyltransferase [Planctomicrobium sp.]MDB4802639.1 GNAT family N-acetyltransferase [bacterium]
MQQTIIQANLGHLDVLVPLFNEYRVFYGRDSDITESSQFLTARLSGGDSVLFFAVDDETLDGLGFAQLYPSFSSIAMKRIWILNDLYVAENARRTGIGRQLMNKVANFAHSSGAVRVDLATAKNNIPAKNLYSKVGYDLDGIFDHYKLSIG